MALFFVAGFKIIYNISLGQVIEININKFHRICFSLVVTSCYYYNFLWFVF